MRIFVAVVLYLLYWGMCFLGTGGDQKSLRSLRSYPKKVQERVRAEKSLADKVPAPKPVAAVLLSNLILFTVVFSLLGIALKHVLELDSYLSAFLYFLFLGEGLGLFDLVVIDLCWWRNTPRIRFSFLPEKEAYQDPALHVDSFLRGIPLFALAAALGAGVVAVL